MLAADVELEDGPVDDLLAELDLRHAAGHEAAARELAAGRQPGEFVHPAQELAAKQVAEMVQVLGPHQRVGMHADP